MAAKGSGRKKSGKKKAASKATASVKKAAKKTASAAKRAVKNPKRTVKSAASNVHRTATRAKSLGDNIVGAGEVLKQTAEMVDALAQRASNRVEASQTTSRKRKRTGSKK
jgi:hypothetical protein